MIPKALAIGLMVAFVGSLLTEMGCKTKRIFIALSLIIMLLGLCSELTGVFGELLSLGESSGTEDAVKSALKIVGIGYVFGISSEVCEELGEPRMASILNLFSRVETFLVTLPFLRELIDMGLRLIE